MFFARRPSDSSIRRQLANQAHCNLSYLHPGITREAARAENSTPYIVDHTRVALGSGAATFDAAIVALRGWHHFSLGWLSATPLDTPIETDAVIAVVAHLLGIWSVNFARIIYAIDESQGPVRRFGFAYGTLPDHIEAGEERFLIEWDTRDDNVFYDIVAYSRPRHPLARIGYPFVRRMQKRFSRESAEAMQRFSRIV